MRRDTMLIRHCGRFVRSRREALGLTQAQVGKRCGLSKTYVADLERATVDPDLSAFLALARGLKMAPDEMLADILALARGVHRPTLAPAQIEKIHEGLRLLHEYFDQVVAWSRQVRGKGDRGPGQRRHARDRKKP